MKQNLPPWLIASIVVVIVVLIGFAAKRTFFQDPDASSVPWEETRAYKEQQRVRAQGQPSQTEASPTASPAANAMPNGQQPSMHPRGAMAGGH